MKRNYLWTGKRETSSVDGSQLSSFLSEDGDRMMPPKVVSNKN
jgi:hypothetical protein